MPINEKRSYTEYVVSSEQSEFTVGFKDYQDDVNFTKDVINVTIDNIDAATAGYTVTRTSPTVITLSPSVPVTTPNKVVRLQRETNIDSSFHVFTNGAKWDATTMDENFEQVRHSQQEVRDGFIQLNNRVLPLVDGLEEALDQAASASQAAQDAADAAQNAAATVQGVGSIADLLLINSPFDGLHVRVKSYYTGDGRGGGDFYFDSTKVAINNGVTIFSGWVRDLSAKILTTDDAGLKGDGTDTDVTNRLRTFAQLSSRNGFTVQMIGTYYPASNIVFSNATDLKIIGINSKIEADRTNWTFDGTKRGVIYANDCPNIVISNLKGLKGVTLTNYNISLGEARMQDGDAGIQLVRCDSNIVMHCGVSYVKTWGILAESCKQSTIIHNTITRCLRQSGINAIVNSSGEGTIIAHNNISECGLYAIELETQVASKGKHLVHDNTIYNCQVGISCVGKVFDTSIHDNMITDCAQAFLTVNVNQTATKSERLKMYANTALRCASGYRYSGTWYTDFYDNTLDGANVPAYSLTSPYHAVEQLINTTSFKSIRNFTVGSTIYINDIAYTVTGSSSAPDTEFGAGTVYTITVNNALTGVQNGDAIKTPVTVQKGIDAWYLENRYTNVTGNTISNYISGYYTQPTMNTGYNNAVSKNRFIDCTNAIQSPTDTPGISFLNNEYVRCTNNPIHVNQVIRGQTSINWFNVENPVPITAGGTKWTVNFNVEDDLFYQAVDLYIFNSATSTGTIVVQLDGVDLVQHGVSTSGTVNSLKNLSSILKLTRGSHTLRIIDTTGAFACAFWRIGFKCV